MNILRDKICLIERENFVKRFFFFEGHKKNGWQWKVIIVIDNKKKSYGYLI